VSASGQINLASQVRTVLCVHGSGAEYSTVCVHGPGSGSVYCTVCVTVSVAVYCTECVPGSGVVYCTVCGPKGSNLAKIAASFWTFSKGGGGGEGPTRIQKFWGSFFFGLSFGHFQ
jgi:hypothetical protein